MGGFEAANDAFTITLFRRKGRLGDARMKNWYDQCGMVGRGAEKRGKTRRVGVQMKLEKIKTSRIDDDSRPKGDARMKERRERRERRRGG